MLSHRVSYSQAIGRHLSSSLYGLIMLCLAACARGYSAQAEHSIAAPVEAAGPVFLGESCTIGERVACACANGAGMGVRACVANASSPTKGALSECLPCSAAPTSNASELALDAGNRTDDGMHEAGRGAAVGGAGRAAGAGGAGRGAGAGAGGGAGGTRSAGAGGRVAQAGSSAGAAGSAPPATSSGACKCDQLCVPIGILACCRSDGSCGCTWAPGSYCL
jgi:hypothetical protein